MEPHPDTREYSRVLAIVAHPDDIEYGFVGTIARWVREGKTVSYLLASRGEAGIDDPKLSIQDVAELREREQRAAAAAVGVTDVEFLDFRDGMITYGLPLRLALARAIRQKRPEVVVTHNFDTTWFGQIPNHADHRAVGLATMDAILDASLRFSFPELEAEGLAPWKGVKRLYVGAANDCNVSVDVTETMDAAVAALRAHAVYTQMFPDFDPDTFLRGAAAEAGSQIGVEYAERFKVFAY